MKKSGRARKWALRLFIAGPAIALVCIVLLLVIRFDPLDGTQYLLYFTAIIAFPVCWIAAFVTWGIDAVVRAARKRRQATP